MPTRASVSTNGILGGKLHLSAGFHIGAGIQKAKLIVM